MAQTTDAMHIMIASSQNTPAKNVADLFDVIATKGSSTVTKPQFIAAMAKLVPKKDFNQAQAEALFSKADPSGSGSVTKGDFVATMTTALKEERAAHPVPDNATAQQAAQTAQNNAEIDGARNPAFDMPRIGRLFNALA